MKSIFFVYFDLRKYSYIDKNYSYNEQFNLLSEMHQIIESDMTSIRGQMYLLQLDTAVYFLPQSENQKIIEKTTIIKNKVDNFFSTKGIPSTLHISCAFGNSRNGKIKLKNQSIFNIAGEVTNYLQQTIFATESKEGKILFDKICFHKSAAENIGFLNFTNKISVFDHDFFYI